MSRRLRCVPVLYCITDVRLITLRSAILARLVRISSCTPSVKKTLSGSRLRFSNGRTATLFSEIDLVVDSLESSPASGARPLREKNKNAAAVAEQNAAAVAAASFGLRFAQRKA